MKQPELDIDGYPTEETLAAIAAWPIKCNKDIQNLLEFAGEAWSYPFPVETGGEDEDRWIRVVTGGWSGNESLVGAMEENRMFWALCWLESRRGGSYKFYTHPIKES